MKLIRQKLILQKIKTANLIAHKGRNPSNKLQVIRIRIENMPLYLPNWISINLF